MSEELISSYIDRAAIKADTDFFLANLKTVADAYANLSGTKINLSFSEGIKASSTYLNQLNENLKQTSAASQQATQSLSMQAKTVKDLSGNYQDLVKASVQNEIATKALREQRQLLNKDFKDGKITQEQYAAGLENVKASELELKVSNEQLSRAMKNLEKDSQAAEGSLDKLRAILNISLQAYDALSAEDKNSDIGKGLIKNIQDLTKEISEQEQATGRFQRNVGNYTGALQPLEKELQRVREELQKTKTAQENLIQSGPTNPSANQNRTGTSGARGPQASDVQAVANYNAQLQQTGATIAELEKQEQLLNNIVATQQRGFSSTTAEIRSLERALFTMQEQGLATTEAFKEIQEKLAEAKRELREFKDTQKLLSAELPGVAALSLAVKGISGAYAIGAGAAAIFADGNEKVEKELNKLVAIMTVLQGLNEVHELLEKKNTIAKIASATATSALTAAQRLYTFVTEGSTVATIAFRAALVSTGIGAVIILLAGFITSMKNSTSATLEQLEAQNKLNDALKDFYEILVKNNEELSERLAESTKELKDQLELYQAMGKNQYDLFSVRKQIAEDEKKNAKDALDDLGLTEAGIERLRIQHDQLNEKLQKGLEFKERAVKVDLGDRQIKVIDAQNESYKKQLETLDSRIKRGDDLIKQINDSDQALKVLNAEEAKFANEDVGKRRIENIKGQLEETAKFYSKVAELDGLLLSTRLKAREGEFDAERTLILRQRDFDLSNVSLTENQRATIITAANRAIRELEEKKVQDILNIRGQYRAKVLEQEKQDNDQFYKDQVDQLKKEEDQQNKTFAARKAYVEEGRDILIKSLEEEKNAKLKAASGDEERQKIEEEYNDKRKKVELEANFAIAESALELVKIKLKAAEEAGDKDKIAELQAQVAALKKQIAELKNVSVGLNTTEADEKINHLKDSITQLMSQVDAGFNAIGSVIDNNVTVQKNAIQKQLDDIDKRTQKEIDAVNTSTVTEQDKANKIAIINANAAAKKEALQTKERQLDIQKARFDKAKNIADAIGKTAIAVLEGLIKGGPALAAVYAGIGAVEIAAAATAPIPQYKGGTSNHPGGPFIAGDGGRSEMVIGPSGELFTTPAVPTLYDMPRGTVVLPDANQAIEQSFHMMYKGILPAQSNNSTHLQIMHLSKKLDAVVNAISAKPVARITNTWSGVQTTFENVSRQWEYVNRNTQS